MANCNKIFSGNEEFDTSSYAIFSSLDNIIYDIMSIVLSDFKCLYQVGLYAVVKKRY
ncbi:unnamed protein product [Brassica rapa]|uniref:Uncharacterized protein n=1 Tax=Brassica campestris TaxID=3711 RepID=A0A3P5XZB4_BRACM|nr:unnamed protein product [Brassica rapa]VDC60159.1 unnamed protein product [Brassica rapa]